MPNEQDTVRLRHMLDAAKKIVEYTDSIQRDDLDKDEKLALAIVRLLEIIGEAAKAVSPDLRRKYPQIPWPEIAGTRDRLIHGYYDIDFDIVWQIVCGDIPHLITTVESILGNI
ncbi:MAG: hypothetical protein A2173_06340 [Planctomycetes bacterium RBG_13_44_8b]|nr:MAG: hypothetical protein A2173_06340 [Planctomycetes bacterium RBG_13_44_8b]